LGLFNGGYLTGHLTGQFNGQSCQSPWLRQSDTTAAGIGSIAATLRQSTFAGLIDEGV
jgi:hypothetical protein